MDSDFFDVTLATSDSGSQSLQAHKVILSACSDFFKQMLRQQSRVHAHPHPFIYLRGISYHDLLSVLDFMYHGEVNVSQENLNSFLIVAEELQVKGLTNKEQAESAAVPVSSPAPKICPVPGRIKEPSGPPLKRPRKLSPPRVVSTADKDYNNENDGEVKHIINVKQDPDVEPLVVIHPSQGGFGDSFGEYYGDDGSGELEGDGTEDDLTAGGSADGGKGRRTGW
jgi:hypothetical protein